RVGIGSNQPPGGGRVGVADAAAQGVAPVAAHAAGPAHDQVGADGAVDHLEGRGLSGKWSGSRYPTVVDAAAHGVAAVAASATRTADRLVVEDGGVGEGGSPAAFVGEAAAPGQTALAAERASAAPRSAAG